jgi:hypothetical protein
MRITCGGKLHHPPYSLSFKYEMMIITIIIIIGFQSNFIDWISMSMKKFSESTGGKLFMDVLLFSTIKSKDKIISNLYILSNNYNNSNFSPFIA